MTHASDRTLLASLGFADPDKREPMHDLACRYLTRPDVATRVYGVIPQATADDGPLLFDGYDRMCPHGSIHRKTMITCGGGVRGGVDFLGGSLEVVVAKGLGRYRSLIGFVDGVLNYAVFPIATGPFSLSCWDGARWSEPEAIGAVALHKTEVTVSFEVKIKPVPCGDIMRQIKLYSEFHRSRHWLLAVAYDVSVSEKQTLASEGVSVVRLGAGFKKFVDDERRSSAAGDVPEL